MDFAVGVDIGGGTTRVGLVRDDGHLRARFSFPTPRGGAPQELMTLVERGVDALREYVLPRPGARLHNVVGIALPGIYDRDAGVVRRAVNLPLLEGFEFRSTLEERLRDPVFVETDVIAAAWAQWRALRSASNRSDRFVYISLGTGIGAGVVLEGEIVRHTRGGGGHLGHLLVDSSPDAPICRCGARGCAEAAICAPIDSECANPAGRRASRVAALGRLLLQISHLYAPELIALGGGIIDHDAALVADAAAAFEGLRSVLVPPELKIVSGPMASGDAGVTGAALLAIRIAKRSN
ncbi:MAG: ROK family protein [Planctomycetia bacterium]|nr:MAG: ROK family protein [Planctomycetia bacterium]